MDEVLGAGGKSGEDRLGEVALAGERFGGAIDDRTLEVPDLREKPGHLPDGRPGVVQRPGDRLGRIGPGDRGHQVRIAGDEAPLVPEGDVPHAQGRGRLLQPALYLPDEISWNYWSVTLTREKSMGMARWKGRGKRLEGRGVRSGGAHVHRDEMERTRIGAAQYTRNRAEMLQKYS